MAKTGKPPTNPFRFGGLALDEAFANREAEVQELKFDVLNGQDVVIFAPRRYGKSSLVWKAMQQLVGHDVLVAYVNLMTTPTKAKLAEKLAAAIYEHVASPAARAKERALAPFRDLRISPGSRSTPRAAPTTSPSDRPLADRPRGDARAPARAPGRARRRRGPAGGADLRRVPGGGDARPRAAEAVADGVRAAARGRPRLPRQPPPHDGAPLQRRQRALLAQREEGRARAHRSRALLRLHPRALPRDEQGDRRRGPRGAARPHRRPPLRDPGALLLPLGADPLRRRRRPRGARCRPCRGAALGERALPGPLGGGRGGAEAGPLGAGEGAGPPADRRLPRPPRAAGAEHGADGARRAPRAGADRPRVARQLQDRRALPRPVDPGARRARRALRRRRARRRRRRRPSPALRRASGPARRRTAARR